MGGMVALYAPSVAWDDGPNDDPGAGPTGVAAGRLRVSRSLSIPLSEIDWRATTSGGPGGQHANKTSSRVEVRFDVARSAALGPRQRARLLERLGPVVRAVASEDRSQSRNRQLAMERLAERIADGLRVDPTRHPTRPTRGSKERRLEHKHRRSQVKRGRRAGRDPED